MDTPVYSDPAIPGTPGDRLRNRREEFGLSQKEVAEHLCLKTTTVRNIENNAPDADLPLIYLRGYIRSYARLLELPEDELLRCYADCDNPGNEIRVPLPRRRQKASLPLQDSWALKITLIIMFCIAIATGIKVLAQDEERNHSDAVEQAQSSL